MIPLRDSIRSRRFPVMTVAIIAVNVAAYFYQSSLSSAGLGRFFMEYGVIPANGLLYAPQHSCACYIEAKLTGLLALKPAEPALAQEITLPSLSVRVTRVLLNDVLM